jgi:LacI family transcriptional regulator
MVRSIRPADRGPATIKDVARESGVCMKTVSNVINSPEIVKSATRQRVLEAIEALDYRPCAAARSLVTHRRNLIGLLLFDITNPAYPEIAEVIINLARKAGFTVLVCNAGRDPGEEDRYIDLLIEQHVDGVIVSVQRWEGTAVAALVRRGIKVVQLNRRSAEVSAPYVGVANENGGNLATKHLLDLGHRRIGFVRGVAYASTSQEREAGYLRALGEYGIAADPSLIVRGEFSVGSTREAARALLARQDRPTAIFAASDLMALGVMDAAAELGLRIPEDLALVGFDDIPLATNAAISLTTVRGGLGQLGEEAIELLLQLINDGSNADEAAPVQRILPVTLQVRRSSGGHIG